MELRITTLIASEDYSGALELLASAHGTAVLRYCAALVGSVAEGEEAYQETLLEAYHGFGRFRNVGGVRAWFFGIARLVCARQLRRRDRRRSLWERFRPKRTPREAGYLPDDPVERSETRVAMGAALAGLKPDIREAVLLRYQAGLNGAEVAVALGVSHAAARKRISLGIQQLRLTVDPALLRGDGFKAAQQPARTLPDSNASSCPEVDVPVLAPAAEIGTASSPERSSERNGRTTFPRALRASGVHSMRARAAEPRDDPASTLADGSPSRVAAAGQHPNPHPEERTDVPVQSSDRPRIVGS
ncbi:MAG: RNA polymerase sigma-70 factor (ECF subfamily) [Myxococcota bacterium]|jgi:RNA polymerase sigma-70 factor (ECF subfamily)